VTILDANVSYGAVYTPTLAPCRTPDDLIGALDWAGIDRALVTADAIRIGCPSEMNVRVAEALARYPRLEPVWAILPMANSRQDTGELGSVSEFLAAMKRYGVRALTAFPSKHRFLLDRLACGELLDAMVERHIPLLLPLDESSGGRAGWALVAELLQGTPGLRLVALGSGPWGDDRLFRPLMRRFPTLYLETSRYELDGGIAELCRAYGPERLIYGSGYPRFALGGPLLTAMHAAIPEQDRALVLGGNMLRLLNEVML